MSDILNTATQALLNNAQSFKRTANNIANANTPGYKSASGQSSGVALEREIVDMIQIKHAHTANLEVIDTAEKMREQLLEIGRKNARR